LTQPQNICLNEVLLMSQRRLDEKEAFELIISVLKGADKPLTTRDIDGEIKKRFVSCPDSLPILLNRLRLRGLVKGQLSTERKGWVWWIETRG
jgi:hypothetical protein